MKHTKLSLFIVILGLSALLPAFGTLTTNQKEKCINAFLLYSANPSSLKTARATNNCEALIEILNYASAPLTGEYGALNISKNIDALAILIFFMVINSTRTQLFDEPLRENVTRLKGKLRSLSSDLPQFELSKDILQNAASLLYELYKSHRTTKKHLTPQISPHTMTIIKCHSKAVLSDQRSKLTLILNDISEHFFSNKNELIRNAEAIIQAYTTPCKKEEYADIRSALSACIPNKHTLLAEYMMKAANRCALHASAPTAPHEEQRAAQQQFLRNLKTIIVDGSIEVEAMSYMDHALDIWHQELRQEVTPEIKIAAETGENAIFSLLLEKIEARITQLEKE